MGEQVTIVQPPAIITEPQSKFVAKSFDQAVFDKGQEVLLERAMKCPCQVHPKGDALPDCVNCNGIGWFFILPTSTRMVVQGIGYNRKQEQWSEINQGMCSITSRAIDYLGWMDRITMLELEATFVEVLNPKLIANKLQVLPTYKPLEIFDLFRFVGSKVELDRLETTEYEIVDNKIVFDDKFKSIENFTVTARYAHNPAYHVIDPNRELMKTRTKEGHCADEETLKGMPLHSMGRRAQYVFDRINFEGNNLIKNV